MDNQELNAMEVLANAATPGPWAVSKIGEKLTGRVWQDGPDSIQITATPANGNMAKEYEANGAFIAAARTFIPSAIAEIRRLSTPTTIGEAKTEGSGQPIRCDCAGVCVGHTVTVPADTTTLLAKLAAHSDLFREAVAMFDAMPTEVYGQYIKRHVDLAMRGDIQPENGIMAAWKRMLEAEARVKELEADATTQTGELAALYEPTSHPMLESDHAKRHAVKDALVELIENQEPITRRNAQRGLGWKLEKLLTAKGYLILAKTEVEAVAAQLEAAERAALASSSPVIEQADKWVLDPDVMPEDQDYEGPCWLAYKDGSVDGGNTRCLNKFSEWSWNGDKHANKNIIGWMRQYIPATPSAPATPSKEEKGGPDGE